MFLCALLSSLFSRLVRDVCHDEIGVYVREYGDSWVGRVPLASGVLQAYRETLDQMVPVVQKEKRAIQE